LERNWSESSRLPSAQSDLIPNYQQSKERVDSFGGKDFWQEIVSVKADSNPYDDEFKENFDHDREPRSIYRAARGRQQYSGFLFAVRGRNRSFNARRSGQFFRSSHARATSSDRVRGSALGRNGKRTSAGLPPLSDELSSGKKRMNNVSSGGKKLSGCFGSAGILSACPSLRPLGETLELTES